MRRIEDDQVIVELECNSEREHVRYEAVELISNVKVLEHIALTELDTYIRLSALEKIVDPDLRYDIKTS